MNNKIVFLLIALAAFSLKAAEDPIPMSLLNEYMSYMTGPGAPKELRQGAMGMGAIHMTCYGKRTVSGCENALRQAGKSKSADFLQQFEQNLPKLTELKAMKEDLESGKINPYEPSDRAVFLQRNCADDRCLAAVEDYMATLDIIREKCTLTRRSNQNQFTIGRSWECHGPITRFQELENTMSTFDTELAQPSQAALQTLEDSTASSFLSTLERDDVFAKCEDSSPLVDEGICKRANMLNNFFDLIGDSIKSRGISDDGDIDLSRQGMFKLTNDRDVLTPPGKPDKYKGYNTVSFSALFQAINDDSKDFTEFYRDRSEELLNLAAAREQAKERRQALQTRYSDLKEELAQRLNTDGLRFQPGGVSAIFQSLQSGSLAQTELRSMVVKTRDMDVSLEDIQGSMLMFASPNDYSFKIALSEGDANQMVVNGSMRTICDCAMVQIAQTKVQRTAGGPLIQIFEVEPYDPAEARELAQFEDQHLQR